MVASSRVRKACSRLRRALWLTTLLAALLHSGMCLQSPHDPDARGPVVQAAEAGGSGSLQTPSSAGDDTRYQADDDGGDQGPGRDVPPGHRHHQAVLRAPGLRSDLAGAVGPLLVNTAPARPHGARRIEPYRTGELRPRAAGASLLTMIGVSRT
jgi:hypothetical protein